MTPVGLGTELVEAEIQKLFPEAKIARADRDEIQNRVDLEELVRGMESGETNILIGTQMIAKGLDFPKLNLGWLSSCRCRLQSSGFQSDRKKFSVDHSSQRPSRSSREARRKSRPSDRSNFQSGTSKPDICAKAHDFESFAEQELEQRQPLNYPPIGKLISFRIQGTQLVQEFRKQLDFYPNDLSN